MFKKQKKFVLNTTVDNKIVSEGKPQYFHLVWLLKRFLIGMIPAILSQLGGLQTIMLIFVFEGYIMYIGYSKPFQKSLQNLKTIVSQTIFMIIIYHVIMFSDLVLDPLVKSMIGTSQVIWLGILITWNLLFITIDSIKDIRRRKHLRILR